MHKKLETQDLDIPMDDIECWERYPKHRWVYDLSRLLDAQNIKWSLFKTPTFRDKELTIYLESFREVEYDPGHIYINRPDGYHSLAVVYLTKGEIKLIRYFDKKTHKETNEFAGNIELRVNAFVSMHFQKFTGVITMEFVGNDIMAIRLRAYPELGQTAESIKLIKRIYKKTEIIVSGPTDQALHEKVAS